MLKSISLLLLMCISFTSFSEQLQIRIVSDEFMVEQGEYDPNLYRWLHNIQNEYKNHENLIKPMLNCKLKEKSSNKTSCYVQCGRDKQVNISMLLMSSGEDGTLMVYVDAKNQLGMISTNGSCKIQGFTPMIDFDTFDKYESVAK